MGAIERYLVTWLLRGNEEAAKMVGYTADPSEWEKYKIVIVPNGHLGKDLVYPSFDNPKLEGGKFVQLDIVYNAFFFTSRAEELINPNRDKYGRFAASMSVLGQENRLQIPLLDEYSRFLIKSLKQACEADDTECPVSLPRAEFGHIYLTHDIDQLEQYRHWRGALGGLVRGDWRGVWNSWCDLYQDPVYTFPWIMEQDYPLERDKERCSIIYFAKHTRGRGYDYPQYDRHCKDYQHLLNSIKRSGGRLGLHSSYYGFEGETNHTDHRSHFLRCDIDNMQRLADAGVTDDFTMGFADMAGFRLQTTRPVRWINPKTYELTSLTLHPLTVMDCTLSNRGYMNLSEDEAYFYCERLFEKVRMHGGDICLLWHNNVFQPNGYHTHLYPKLLKLLQ